MSVQSTPRRKAKSQTDQNKQVHNLLGKLRDAFPPTGSDEARYDGVGSKYMQVGMPFPLALLQISKIWLGSSTPSENAILGRFGIAPGEEALSALAAELRAEIKINRDRSAFIKTAQTPIIAELSDGQAIVVAGQESSGHLRCITATGEKLYFPDDLAPCLTGLWLSVYESISKSPAGNEDSQLLSGAVSSAGKADGGHVSWLLSLTLSNNRANFVKLIAAAFMSNALLVTLPLFITIVYDRVVPHGAFETLTALTVGATIALAMDVGLRSARITLQEAIGVRVVLRLQAAVYRKLVAIPLEKGQKIASGFLTTLSELEVAAMLSPQLITGLLVDLPSVLVMLALVYFLTGPMALVPVAGISVIAMVTFVGNRAAKKRAGDTHAARIALQDQAIETCGMLASTKASGAEHQLLSQWERRCDVGAFLSHKSRITTQFSNQLTLNITQITIVLSIVVGAILVNKGDMTLGNLAASTLLIARMIAPISQLIGLSGQFANIQSSLSRVHALVHEVEELGGDDAAVQGGRLQGRIQLRNITFGYPECQQQSLQDISLKIEPGEKVAVIGRNGSGKSTLLRLIPRFYLPQDGVMSFDGLDARQISPAVVRRSVGYMSQDTVLMNDTLRVNICAGNTDVDEEEFAQAVDISAVAQFAEKNPAGYNLKVGPRGEHLSGGERQAVGLARVILQDPSILVLDEPTSALDNTAELKLIKDIKPYLENRTLIMATHRMSMLALVDRVIWVDGGRILADGPRDEVLQELKRAA